MFEPLFTNNIYYDLIDKLDVLLWVDVGHYPMNFYFAIYTGGF